VKRHDQRNEITCKYSSDKIFFHLPVAHLKGIVEEPVKDVSANNKMSKYVGEKLVNIIVFRSIYVIKKKKLAGFLTWAALETNLAAVLTTYHQGREKI
jgi:hypothetical protein